MDFKHTEERRLLSDAVSRYLADNYPIEKRHEAAASDHGFAREQWTACAEQGFIGALFSEAHGGIGGAPFDIAVMFQEFGRGLVVEPFLATLLAGRAVAELGSESQQAILEDVIAGTKLLAFAHGEPHSRYDLSHVTTRAESSADGWTLNGHKTVVINGDSADLLLISARTASNGADWDESGLSLFLVPVDGTGIELQGYPTIDGLHAAEVRLNNVKLSADALLGERDRAFASIEKVASLACLALSAEALGLMEVCRDMTAEYLQTRKQFGAPLIKFQALAHRMATLLTEIEQARSAVINAAGRFDNSRLERERTCSTAKALTGRIGRLVAEESIQMHGGIAMTWEYALGHYAKRLIMIDHQFGDVDFHTARYSQLR